MARLQLLVDVEALQAAVHNAAIPASLAFPIFDAAGLGSEALRPSLKQRGGVQYSEAPRRRNKGRGSSSSRAHRADGKPR